MAQHRSNSSQKYTVYIKTVYKCILAVLLVWFALLLLAGNLLGLLGLGLVLLITSVWWLLRAREVYLDYQRYYKKLPKKKQSKWNEPKDIYYQVSVFFFMPLGIAAGSLFIYLYWILK